MKLKVVVFLACVGVLALMSYRSSHNTNEETLAELKHFNTPDEIREFPFGKVELVTIGGATVGRATLEPGWRWSTSIQPLSKTESCEAPHFQYHISGVLMVQMDDGTLLECKAGDISLLPSGHDAWVVGKKPVVLVDFQGMIDYATDK